MLLGDRWLLLWLLVAAFVLGCDERVVVGYEPQGTQSSAGGGETAAELSATGTSDVGATAASDSAVTNATGATGSPLPMKGALLWSADFETGDDSQWVVGDVGWAFVDNDARYLVTNQHAHASEFALEASVVSIGNQLPQAMLLRYFELYEGYYSAYFCVLHSYNTSFLVMMKFMSDENFRDNPTPDLFDIDLSMDDDDGQLYLQLDEHGGEAILSSVPVPIATWFQVEVFYRSSPDNDGRLVVWQDGVVVFDIGGRATAPSNHVVFGAGMAAWRVSPLPASIFIDDVQVSGVQ